MKGNLPAAIAAALLAPFAAMAQTQQQPPEIPCDTTKLVIKLANVKCAQLPDQQLMLGGVPGTGRMAKGPVRLQGEFETGRAIVIAHLTDAPDVGMVPMREADVPARVARDTQNFRTGALSALRTVGNAWAMTFRSATGDCVWFDNFGPAQGIGYAWEITGVYCKPPEAAGSGEFSDEHIKRIMTVVLPQ